MAKKAKKGRVPKERNWFAVAAHWRKAGAMRDRRLKRGKAKEMRELREELD